MKLLIRQLFNYNCGMYALAHSFLTFGYSQFSKEETKVGIKLSQGFKQYASLEPFGIGQKIQNEHRVCEGKQDG